MIHYEPVSEELDSYLYQTVGQDAIEFVGRALDVPLYRRVIAGAAVEQGGEYGGRDPSKSGGIHGDETEDLYELLLTVKVLTILIVSLMKAFLAPHFQTHHPEVLGVSVGAILSNYQRVRVEHVYVLVSTIEKIYPHAAQVPTSWSNSALLSLAAGPGRTARRDD